MGWGISFSALLLNTVLWLFLCGLLFAQEPVAAKPQSHLLVIKTKTSLDHWNSDRLFTQLRSSPLGKQIRDLKRSFKRQSQWSSSPPFPYDRYVTLTLQPNSSLPKAIAELQRLESIESVQLDYELTDPAIELPSDPELPQQWYLSHLKIPQAWPLADGSGIFVADIESGFDTEHPDLVNQFDLSRSFDYDPDTDDENSVNDNKRTHGTPVCGIIAAEANNDLFGVGIAYGATLIGSQMANSYSTHISHEAWTVITAKAILGSVEQGADVILIEKQVPALRSSVERIDVIYDAIKAAVDANVVVIVPAGNFGRELKEEAELNDSGAILVGSLDQTNTPLSTSNFGMRVNVAAPGKALYSIQQNNGETTTFGGTSGASAITAGVVALIRSANRDLSPRKVRSILVKTGIKVEGKSVGRLIDAASAVRAALER